MNSPLASTLILCDLDELMLGPGGQLDETLRCVLELFCGRGGRFTVFSQRTPRAVRALLSGLKPGAPALVCGGNLAYDFSSASGQPLRTFAPLGGEFISKLPAAPGVGIALQMKDGATRVLRMSLGLEKHLRRESTPYLLGRAADINGADVLRVLLYQDNKTVPLLQLLDKSLGSGEQYVRAERLAPDTLVLTPSSIPASAMLEAVCLPLLMPAESVFVLAGGQPMKELVRAAGQSAVPCDAPDELRRLAKTVTLTPRAGGAAAEVLYSLVRAGEGCA